jgi:hypothetical protein
LARFVSSLLRLRADCVCLGIWRDKAVSERVAGGIAGLGGSGGSGGEKLLDGDNVFVRGVMNLAGDCSEGPNLIRASSD